MNPLLTLPPQVGRHYRYRLMETDEVFTCEIIGEDRFHKGEQVWDSMSEEGQRNWVYWADGEAKISDGEDYVAVLIEDVHISPELPESEDFKELREGHDAMMQRLTSLERSMS